MKKDYKKYKTTKLKTFFRHPAFLAVLIVVLAGGSVLLHMTTETSELVKGISDTITMLAAIGFWFELKSSKEANEANFIMELNDQFISNEDLTRVEHALELYYNQWSEGKAPLKLDLELSRDSRDCQSLINYLVYMEGLAALVDRSVMHVDVIDNLFAYRFFIAVNNPIVQRFELFPYANYYQGCFELSKKWTEQWQDEKRPIPMVRAGESHALCECDKSLLNKPYEAEVKDLVIRKVRQEDDLLQVARCLYRTDPYIYPTAFGDDIEQAAKAIVKLMKTEGSLLDYANLTGAFSGGTLCGILLCNEHGLRWDEDACVNIIEDLIPSEKSFRYASKHYFAEVAQCTAPGQIEVVALCVQPEFRNKGVAKRLLQQLSEDKPDSTFTLDVLADNYGAVTLYRHCGFVVTEQHKGFSKDETARPDCYRMVKTVR